MARYYHTDSAKNARVSAEITGYSVSALAYLHTRTGQPAYRAAEERAAKYLLNGAWDSASSTFPFEPGSDKAYFFDIGIIVRGLIAAGETHRARQAALSLAFDFLGDSGTFHPVISLPGKQPLPYEPRWSRSPGCYQLKSAMAWLSVDDPNAAKLYELMLAYSLATHEMFLAADLDREKLMDRLHAYCYFLEGLLPVASRTEARAALSQGLARAAALFREIAPVFCRSDVPAQILRVRLIAHHDSILPLDEAAAREEAEVCASFQALSGPGALDPRVRGGFWFGKKQGQMLPFANPVSTAFCVQALDLWNRHRAGDWDFDLRQLI